MAWKGLLKKISEKFPLSGFLKLLVFFFEVILLS